MRNIIKRYWWVALAFISGTVLLEEGSVMRLGDIRANSIAQLKTYHPTDGATVYTTAYSISRPGGGAKYTFFLSATGAGNDHDSIKPSVGNGMWVMTLYNNTVDITTFGCVGDGTTDNTANFQAVNNYISKNLVTAYIPAGIFTTDALTVGNYSNFIGYDSSVSIIKIKSYATHVKTMFTIASGTNISFRNIKFLGGQSFSSSFAISTGNIDTASAFFSITSSKYIGIYGCVFKNGATEGCIKENDIQNCYFRGNTIDSVGGYFIADPYIQSNKYIYVEDNAGLGFGFRDKADAGGTGHGTLNVRHGQDFASGGGTFIYYKRNKIYNSSHTRWAWGEFRFSGYFEITDNYFNGGGMGCFGVTIANSLVASTPYASGKYSRNVQDSIYADKFKSTDSIGSGRKYTFGNLLELNGLENVEFADNVMYAPHIAIESHIRNIMFRNNAYLDHGEYDPTAADGAVLFGIGQSSSTDTQFNIKLVNETIRLKNGKLMVAANGGAWINGFLIDRSIIEFYGGGGALGEIFVNTTGRNHTGIGITNSFILGSYSPAWFTYDVPGTLKISFNNNTFPAGDSTTNFQVPLTGSAATYDKEGTLFSSTAYKYSIYATNALLALKAPLLSPALTGTPTVPTASLASNNSTIASTQYVDLMTTQHYTLIGTDANLTISNAYDYYIKLPVITANRTLTMPAAASFTGRTIEIIDINTSAFVWLCSTTKDLYTNAILSFPNKTSLKFYSDGTNWVCLTQMPLIRQALTDGSTIPWDASLGVDAYVTLGGNRTLSITNAQTGSYGTLLVTQDGTGSRTLTLPAGSKVGSGGSGVITLSTAAGSIDILTYYYDSVNYFWTFNKNFN